MATGSHELFQLRRAMVWVNLLKRAARRKRGESQRKLHVEADRFLVRGFQARGRSAGVFLRYQKGFAVKKWGSRILRRHLLQSL